MKTLLLVRHAKSGWDDPSLTDFDRPLNKRGKTDAPFMANLVASKNLIPDLIISSPANRAFSTACFYANAFDYPQEKIIEKEIIYTGSSRQIIEMIRETPKQINCLFLFGHNPDITSIANKLSDADVENMRTCSSVCIDFDCDEWDQITNKLGTTRFYYFPKMFI